tara:strand:- start:800 stop:1249 length:450 start_codon:yes stop_codon:yes gene_type:complete
MEKYIGEKKVSLAPTIIEGSKTPAGNPMVEVNFVDGSKEVMPQSRFELIATSEKSNASAVQEVLKQKVGGVLYGVLHEYGILMGEADTIINECADLVNAGYEKARDIKWGYTHRLLPLNEINKILVESLKKDATKDNNGASSVGSGTDK